MPTIVPDPTDTPQQARRSAEERLAAVLELHQSSVASAGEYDDGTCAYCSSDPSLPLLRRYRDHLNGSRTKVWMHDHPDSYPYCPTCADQASWDNDRASWPCDTYLAASPAAVEGAE